MAPYVVDQVKTTRRLKDSKIAIKGVNYTISYRVFGIISSQSFETYEVLVQVPRLCYVEFHDHDRLIALSSRVQKYRYFSAVEVELEIEDWRHKSSQIV